MGLPQPVPPLESAAARTARRLAPHRLGRCWKQVPQHSLRKQVRQPGLDSRARHQRLRQVRPFAWLTALERAPQPGSSGQ